MVNDDDVWRSAKLYIQLHGERAKAEAAIRSNELRETGDIEGATVWACVTNAIIELQTRTVQ